MRFRWKIRTTRTASSPDGRDDSERQALEALGQDRGGSAGRVEALHQLLEKATCEEARRRRANVRGHLEGSDLDQEEADHHVPKAPLHLVAALAPHHGPEDALVLEGVRQQRLDERERLPGRLRELAQRALQLVEAAEQEALMSA